MKLVKYECYCGRIWYGKYEKFISPGICICSSDHIKLTILGDLRILKLKRILDGNETS